MHFLVTTAADSGDIGEGDVLLAGDWCGDISRFLQGGADLEVLPYPAFQEQAVKIHSDIDAVFSDLLSKITSAYNSEFSINENEKYYETIIGRWLFHFLHNIYEKKYLLEAALEMRPELTMHSCGLTYATSLDSIDYCMQSYSSDDFNFKQYSCVASFFAEINKESVAVPACPVGATHPEYGIKAFLKNAFWFLLIRLNGIFRKRMILVVSPYYPKNSFFNAIWFFVKSKGDIVHFQFSPVEMVEKSLDIKLRQALANRVAPDAESRLSQIASKALFNFIPMSYVEGFMDNKLKAQSWLRMNPNLQRVFTANAIHMDEAFKYMIAESKHNELWIFQHGSGYGFSEIQSSEDYERALADRYFTWGWGELQLPSPKLCHESPVQFGRNKDIVLTVPTVTFYSGLLESYFISSDYRGTIEMTDSFLLAIHPELRSNILLRQRDLPVLRVYKPIVGISDDRIEQFHDSIKRSRFHVSNHLGTPVLESLAMNVPTLVFYDSNVQRIRESAQPYFQKLRDASVLFDDPVAAAKHLSAVYDDVASWWLSRETQLAVTSFCDHFAQSSPDWRNVWLKTLRGN